MANSNPSTNSNFPDPISEYFLDKLSSDELELLSSEITEELSKSAQGTNEEISKLANTIESYLSTLPQACPDNLSDEKRAALDFVKSASYIDGFINEACGNGLDVTQAIDLYDYSLTRMLNEQI